MQTLSEIKELLAIAGHEPKKSLGQNFLIDHNLIRKLVDSSGVEAGDLVLEVGPGTGALTVELLERGCKVVACELDRAFVTLLNDTLGKEFGDQLLVIEGDCLSNKRELNVELKRLLGDQPFKLVANLPYHAATPLMLALMTQYMNCTGMYTTIQHEVVERFGALPGSKAYGTISVIAQCLGEVGLIAKLAPGCFWPPPNVGSAMMRWERASEIDSDSGSASEISWWPTMADMTQSFFQRRRKKLSGSVKSITTSPIDWPSGVTSDDRIDSLMPQQVNALCQAVYRVSKD
ncbi:MAG: 16S rRNA (adenine(1518)-N(6)/adenine(1519)-N(6))-dimethyltransferase RsmA [Phycisphaerales bacterium]|nr:16S rRNA (adenine(1518)-N(6)/adenine(1519)-N(6))-dimethyltransferase RsmA [Phycisphaerales bacterium]